MQSIWSGPGIGDDFEVLSVLAAHVQVYKGLGELLRRHCPTVERRVGVQMLHKERRSVKRRARTVGEQGGRSCSGKKKENQKEEKEQQSWGKQEGMKTDEEGRCGEEKRRRTGAAEQGLGQQCTAVSERWGQDARWPGCEVTGRISMQRRMSQDSKEASGCPQCIPTDDEPLSPGIPGRLCHLLPQLYPRL
eukprot:1381995-Rhodomonas_salina.1